VKSISFPRNPAAFQFTRDRGLMLGGSSLFLRSGDLPVGRVGGCLYLSVSCIIGCFDLTVRRSQGAPNGYGASKQR
jgi:hypothetical protein